MSNFPLPPNEDERLDALNAYNILDSLDEAEYDAITSLASQLCQTPIALISLVDDKRQWFKSVVGLPSKQTPKEQAFCAHTILQQNPMVVSDARTDSRFASNPLVTGDPNIVFYAGVPLITSQGHALGSLCVIDTEARQLTPQQLNSLQLLSKQVLTLLELRRKNEELQAANKALLESGVFIQNFASMVAHDIKNPLSSMLLSSQALQRRLQKTEDLKSEKLVEMNIQSTRQLLHMVDEILVYSKTPADLLDRRDAINLNSLLYKVLQLIHVPATIHVKLPNADLMLLTSAVALEQIFLNLLTNAIRYNDKNAGLIEIHAYEDEHLFNFEVVDNGTGIEPRYLNRIFEDKFTLGHADRFSQQGTGIGLSTVKALVEKLGGSIYAQSIQGQGATFYFSIKK